MSQQKFISALLCPVMAFISHCHPNSNTSLLHNESSPKADGAEEIATNNFENAEQFLEFYLAHYAKCVKTVYVNDLDIKHISQVTTAPEPPDCINRNYLVDRKNELVSASQYTFGKTAGADTIAVKMLEQFIYLEIYRIYHLEYLMTRYAKALLLVDGMKKQQAVDLFDRYVPEIFFRYYDNLKEKRSQLRNGLARAFDNPETITETKAHILGTIEGAALGIAYVESEKYLTGQHYDLKSSEYEKKLQEWDNKKNLIINSHSIINTAAIKPLVERYSKELGQSVVKDTEAVVQHFKTRFDQFIDDEKKIIDIVDYFANGELETLAKELHDVFSKDQQSSFRAQLSIALNDAVTEISENVAFSLKEYSDHYHNFNLAKQIIEANIFPNQNNHIFANWLIKVFQQGIVHWLIVEDFPVLQAAAEQLTTNFVSPELDYQKSESFWNIVKVSVALTAVPMLSTLSRRIQKSKNTWFRVLGKSSLTALAVYPGWLTYKMIVDAVNQWHDWRSIQRLTRLNVEGMSLTTLLQEDQACYSFWWRTAVASASGLLTLATVPALWNPPALVKTKNNLNLPPWYFQETSKGLFNGSFNSIKSWSTAIKTDLQEMAFFIKTLNRQQLGKHSYEIAMRLRNIMNKIIFGSVSPLTKFLANTGATQKKFAANAVTQSLNAIVLAVVINIMNTTLGQYINAGTVKMFTWAYSQIGLEAPAYWQQNALNLDYRALRIAINTFVNELTSTKSEIAKVLIFRAQAKEALRNPLTSEEAKNDFKHALSIYDQDQLIKSLLAVEIIRWYLDIEFRHLRMSIMESLGYKLIPNPSISDPNKDITLILNAAQQEKPFSLTLRTKQIDQFLKINTIDQDSPVLTPQALQSLQEMFSTNGHEVNRK